MGGGGASVGKLIKGKGGDVSGNGQQQAPAPVVDGIASRQDVGANETAKHLSAFSDVAKEVDVWRKERRQAMLAAMDGPRHTRIAALVKEMTESARARLASEAEQKAKELRESLSRWTDAQQATRAEFDERVSLRDRRHHSADAQLTTLIAMFAEHMGNSTRELTALKEGLVRDLQAEIDTLRAQASEFTRANRLAVDALQRGSQESIALEESELAQAREAVKDQERLSALRVTLHAQIESCEQEYAAQHAEYVSTNGERTEEFVGMIERDRVVSQAIARNEALQARLTASCEDARRNLNAHRLQCANVNNGLSQANEKMLGHTQSLRHQLKHEARKRKQCLQEMVLSARETMATLQGRLDLCERILRLWSLNKEQKPAQEIAAARFEVRQLRSERARLLQEHDDLKQRLNGAIGTSHDFARALYIGGKQQAPV